MLDRGLDPRQFPDARTILVDAGGVPGSGFDIGERVVSPALRALGVRSIDTLVVTHGDPDHIGGAPAVLRRFAPRQVWEGVPVPPHPALRDLESAAWLSGASWRTVQSGDHELDGGVQVRVLHPPPPEWERQRVRNEDSVVLELRLGDVSIVLPGDIGREAEQLAGADGSQLRRSRLSRHRTTAAPPPALSPSFRRYILPPVIFSAGRGNRFGHPAPVVVARYAAAHSMVFRTDEDGAIVLDTDGRSVGDHHMGVGKKGEVTVIRISAPATVTLHGLTATFSATAASKSRSLEESKEERC